MTRFHVERAITAAALAALSYSAMGADLIASAPNKLGGRLELYAATAPDYAGCRGPVAKEWGDGVEDKFGCWKLGPNKDVILVQWDTPVKANRTYWLKLFEFTGRYK